MIRNASWAALAAFFFACATPAMAQQCMVDTTVPSLVSGDRTPLRCDANGKLIVSGTGGGGGGGDASAANQITGNNSLASIDAGIPAALGQTTMAGSMPVVLPSNQSAIPVTGTFWQATQPVTAASLPLPSGASTSAKQPALGTAGSPSADVLTVQGSASGTPLPVAGSFSATIGGFQPGNSYAQLAVTTTSSRVALPTGTVVTVYNTGTTNAFVLLGNSSVVATTGNDMIPANSWMSFTVGANTNLAAITASNSTSLNLSGGAGIATGAGGVSGSGMAGVTIGGAIGTLGIPFGGTNASGLFTIPNIYHLGSTTARDALAVALAITDSSGNNATNAGTYTTPLAVAANYAGVPTASIGTVRTYAAGQAIGGLQTLAAFRSNAWNSGVLSGVSVGINNTTTAATPSLKLMLFESNPNSAGTTCTDGSAFQLATADLPKRVGLPIALVPATFLPTGTTNINMTEADADLARVLRNRDSTTNIYACLWTETSFALETAGGVSLIARFEQH